MLLINQKFGVERLVSCFKYWLNNNDVPFRKSKLEEKLHRYVSYDDVVNNVKNNIDKMTTELGSCEKALEILTVDS